jgi:hypothetical protein
MGRRIGKLLDGHADRVLSAALSPDGKRVVNRIPGREGARPCEERVQRVVQPSRQTHCHRVRGTARLWGAEAGRPIGEP